MTQTCRSLHLVARPEGLPKDTDFALRHTSPEPLGDGEVRIAVRWLSIDPAMRVWMSEQKSYWPPVGLGEVMRSAGIGEVVESRHPRLPTGTWVSGMTGAREQFVCDGKGFRAFDVRSLPHPAWALSVFGATGLTAYFGLKEIGRVKSGETVVVSAAAGAVGSTVVQVARNYGCRVVAIAGGPDKCAWLKDGLGAHEVIDYKHEKVAKRLAETCPDGVDVYFDNVGGEILDAVLRRLKLHARIVLCGGISQYNATGVPVGPANYLSLISSRGRMEGFVVIDYLDRAGEAIAEFGPWAAAGKLTSRIDEVAGLDHFADALRRLYTGQNFGKQVVKV